MACHSLDKMSGLYECNNSSCTLPILSVDGLGGRDYLSLLSVLPLGALPEGARARAVGDQRLRSLASRAIQRRTLDSGGNYSASGRPIER